MLSLVLLALGQMRSGRETWAVSCSWASLLWPALRDHLSDRTWRSRRRADSFLALCRFCSWPPAAEPSLRRGSVPPARMRRSTESTFGTSMPNLTSQRHLPILGHVLEMAGDSAPRCVAADDRGLVPCLRGGFGKRSDRIFPEYLELSLLLTLIPLFSQARGSTLFALPPAPADNVDPPLKPSEEDSYCDRGRLTRRNQALRCLLPPRLRRSFYLYDVLLHELLRHVRQTGDEKNVQRRTSRQSGSSSQRSQSQRLGDLMTEPRSPSGTIGRFVTTLTDVFEARIARSIVSPELRVFQPASGCGHRPGFGITSPSRTPFPPANAWQVGDLAEQRAARGRFHPGR